LSISLFRCNPKIADVNLPKDTLESFSIEGSAPLESRWWTAFEDDTLNLLIDSALSTNYSLQAAWYQIEQSQAIIKGSKSGLFPQIDASTRSGISRPEPDFVGGENTQLTLSASYEVDLWGRIRYAMHADQYRYQASVFDYKAASISLSANITLAWYRLKANLAQRKLLNQQLSNNEKVLALIRARFAGGQVKGVDILRQQQLIESVESQKLLVESQIGVFQNQLSVLTGGVPRTIQISDSSTLSELPPMPETGVPLNLINRRPDVLSAYYNLQASDRQLASAISNKYPRLNLSLSAAVRSNSFDVNQLIESQASTLSGSLLAPLFYGRRLQAEVDRSEAVKNQTLNQYGQTVLNAFQEVENALIREKKQKQRIAVIEKQIDLASRTYKQLRIEYLNGSLPYLDVLVAQNQEQQLRRDLINAQLALYEIRIALYRSLAGGFETERESALETEI